MKHDFTQWLSTFRDSIATYDYYTDFPKVYLNVDNIKIELNILNSLIGSKKIKSDFEQILQKYPETLKCIPILLAVRNSEIAVSDEDGIKMFDFAARANTTAEYSAFMEKTGLFDLLSNHLIANLADYVTGVETGLDSNGRKNRGGHLMEDLVESYIINAGYVRDESYFKEEKKANDNKNKINNRILYSLNSNKNEFFSKVRCMNYLDANKYLFELRKYIGDKTNKENITNVTDTTFLYLCSFNNGSEFIS